MIELRKYHALFFDALNSYQLDEIQSNFTRDFNYCINERQDLKDPLKIVVTILFDKYPVGFFVLDAGEDKYRYTDNPASILIRSLSINPDYQGKGIGKESMKLVSKFVTDNFKDIEELVLAVNFKNEAAYHVYLKAGFDDNGKVFEGRMGPQHVLTKKLF